MNPFRRPLIAGNWKMNSGGRDACTLAHDVAVATKPMKHVDVVIAPPFTALAAVAHEVQEARGTIETPDGVGVAGQNLHWAAAGAYTGEISAQMLLDAGATWVIIGHSERRQHFGETDEGVEDKTKRSLKEGLAPIVCVGETLEEREAGKTLEVVERQVRAFMELFASDPGKGCVAYEPVWAIGTGKVASPADAQEVHAKIRALLNEVSEEVAEATRILYGGSVKADNAEGLLDQVDIDGALVGGASLDAAGFAKIAAAAQTIAERSEESEDEGGDEEVGEVAAEEREGEAAAPREAGDSSDVGEEMPEA
jgi:triosephosphate isomerase